MPSGPCGGCGMMTNSTTSDWWDNKGKKFGEATECYARHDGTKWVEGCMFHKLNKGDFRLTFAKNAIRGKK